jgi:hypothetical protein
MMMPKKNTPLKDRVRYFRQRDATLTGEIERAENGFHRSVLQQRRTVARRRLTDLEKIMRHDVPATVPGPGLQLVVRRQFTSGNRVYPVGSIITDVTVLGRNYPTLMSSHYLEWGLPPASPARPYDRAVPQPQKTNPAIEIVDDPDPVASWRKTLALTAARLDGDWGKARDLILADRAGADLFRMATRLHTASQARKRGLISVSPEGL